MGWIKEGLLDLVPFRKAIKNRGREPIELVSDVAVDLALVALGLIIAVSMTNLIVGLGVYFGGKVLMKCVDFLTNSNDGAFR